MRNSYIIHTLASVGIQEIVKTGYEVIDIFEGVIFWVNFKESTFRNVLDKLIALRQKY